MKNLIIKLFLFYLRFFARLQLAKINPIIVGIGGANGKSSLTHISNIILKNIYKVKQSGGKNSETGIPLDVLGLEMKDYSYSSWLKVVFMVPLRLLFDWNKYDVYLVEMGIDSPKPPKNMDYLLKFIKPDISVLTNIQVEHTAYFDDDVKADDDKTRKNRLIDEISKQEELLISRVGPEGRVIVNIDDERIKSILPVDAKTLSVSSRDNSADFYITSTEVSDEKFGINFLFLNEKYSVEIPQPLPKYYAYIIVFSIAISFANEVGVEESIGILEEEFSLPAGRFSLFKGIKGSLLLDSSYNSSLEASVGVLEVADKISKNRRRVGIFGNMNELGSVSKLQHELLAKEMIKKLDFAIIIGEELGMFAKPIFDKEGFNYVSYSFYSEAKDEIEKKINKNDLVVIKASQNGMLLERVVEDLLEERKDKEKLCRRGKYWDKKRRNTK